MLKKFEKKFPVGMSRRAPLSVGPVQTNALSALMSVLSI